MAVQDNREIVRRYFEQVWNRGDMQAANEVLAYNFSLSCGALEGREAIKMFISEFRSVFPDVHFTILSMLNEGDKVVVSWVLTGANPDKAARPTTGLGIYRIANDRIAEAWAHTDNGAPRRIGIVQETGPGTYDPAAGISRQ